MKLWARVRCLVFLTHDVYKILSALVTSATLYSQSVASLGVLPARRYASAGTSYGPVSLSVTSRCSIEVVGRIELVFGMEASFDQSYAVF